jgi:hypothetical protein
MTVQMQIGDITIHRIVEQEAPFFDPREFFPTLARKCWTKIFPGCDRRILIR